MSFEIIYYMKHSIFYLYSPGSSKGFANNSLTLRLSFSSITAFLDSHIPSQVRGR